MQLSTQHRVNRLRDHIASTTEFESAHKQRVLQQVERVQREIHKRVSDVDRLIELLGKVASCAKPLVDRLREIVAIVR